MGKWGGLFGENRGCETGALAYVRKCKRWGILGLLHMIKRGGGLMGIPHMGIELDLWDFLG